MDMVPEDNKTRRFFREPVSPKYCGSTIRMDLAMFIIALPVMIYSASTFHLRALNEIYSLWKWTSPTPILKRFYKFGSMNLLVRVIRLMNLVTEC